jgi:nitroreductase
MEVQQALLTRRSIRKYSGKEVSDEQIEAMIRAAMYAPSARNQQPWHFIVLRDKATLAKIPVFHPNSTMITGASAGILVCADIQLEQSVGYWIQDVAAATQNILLSAHGMEIGAVWLGIYPREERTEGIKNLLSLPPHILPFSIISVGYPAETPPHPDRFKPERIHFEKW